MAAQGGHCRPSREFTCQAAFGKLVRVEPVKRDRYGRIMADVIEGGAIAGISLTGAKYYKDPDLN